MAYNCSPSFNWKAKLSDEEIANYQKEIAKLGYKFQFVTLAGFHALNHSMFELARGYKERGMAAYSELQQAEFASEKDGYTATRHQREVGTGYFDEVHKLYLVEHLLQQHLLVQQKRNNSKLLNNFGFHLFGEKNLLQSVMSIL